MRCHGRRLLFCTKWGRFSSNRRRIDSINRHSRPCGRFAPFQVVDRDQTFPAEWTVFAYFGAGLSNELSPSLLVLFFAWNWEVKHLLMSKSKLIDFPMQLKLLFGLR